MFESPVPARRLGISIQLLPDYPSVDWKYQMCNERCRLWLRHPGAGGWFGRRKAGGWRKMERRAS